MRPESRRPCGYQTRSRKETPTPNWRFSSSRWHARQPRQPAAGHTSLQTPATILEPVDSASRSPENFAGSVSRKIPFDNRFVELKEVVFWAGVRISLSTPEYFYSSSSIRRSNSSFRSARLLWCCSKSTNRKSKTSIKSTETTWSLPEGK